MWWENTGHEMLNKKQPTDDTYHDYKINYLIKN